MRFHLKGSARFYRRSSRRSTGSSTHTIVVAVLLPSTITTRSTHCSWWLKHNFVTSPLLLDGSSLTALLTLNWYPLDLSVVSLHRPVVPLADQWPHSDSGSERCWTAQVIKSNGGRSRRLRRRVCGYAVLESPVGWSVRLITTNYYNYNNETQNKNTTTILT